MLVSFLSRVPRIESNEKRGGPKPLPPGIRYRLLFGVLLTGFQPAPGVVVGGNGLLSGTVL